MYLEWKGKELGSRVQFWMFFASIPHWWDESLWFLSGCIKSSKLDMGCPQHLLCGSANVPAVALIAGSLKFQFKIWVRVNKPVTGFSGLVVQPWFSSGFPIVGRFWEPRGYWVFRTGVRAGWRATGQPVEPACPVRYLKHWKVQFKRHCSREGTSSLTLG